MCTSRDDTRRINSTAFNNVRANRIWIFNEYHPQTAEMSGSIVVNWTLPDGSIRKLYADRAVYSKPGWTFFKVKEFEQAGEAAPIVPVPQTNELAMPEFDETPAEIENEIKMSEYREPALAQTEHSALGALGISAAASEFAARRGGQMVDQI